MQRNHSTNDSMLWLFMISLVCCATSILCAQPPMGAPSTFLADGLIDLAAREQVLKDLGIATDAPEAVEIRKLSAKMRQEIQDKVAKSGDETKVDKRAIAEKVQVQFLPELQKLLKPDQFTRVKQIYWQQSGRNALLDPELAKSLNVTKEQQDKLAAAQTEFYTNYRKSFSRPGVPAEGNVQDFRKKLEESRQVWDQKFNDILSKEQKEGFLQAKGKPFDFAVNNSGRPRGPVSLRPGGLMDLATMEPVLKELGIAKDAPEVAELRKLAVSMKQELGQRLENPTPEDRDNLQAIGQQVQSKFDPELKRLLKPDQYTRLRQIHWQQNSANALNDAEVVKALDIKPEQQQKLFDAENELLKKRRKLLNSELAPFLANNKEVQAKVQELKQEQDTKIKEILTKEQQEKFAELNGKPFDLTLLRREPMARGAVPAN